MLCANRAITHLCRVAIPARLEGPQKFATVRTDITLGFEDRGTSSPSRRAVAESVSGATTELTRIFPRGFEKNPAPAMDRIFDFILVDATQ
jgi:hypothetical protein